jgi:hypothetical protein
MSPMGDNPLLSRVARHWRSSVMLALSKPWMCTRFTTFADVDADQVFWLRLEIYTNDS